MAPDVRRPVDRWLVLFALALVAVGMVWIYSASAIKASQNHAAATAFLTRQLLGGVIGIACMLALSQVDLTPLQDHPRPLQITYGILVLLLAAVLFFGPKINGAHRWIRLGAMSLQPSELFKPLSVLIAAGWMVRHREAWTSHRDALPKLLGLAGIMSVPLALILREPDFGTSFLIVFVTLMVVFLGGAPKWIFAVAIPVLGALGTAFVVLSPYRLARVTSFLNPAADPLGKGHQALQSLVAVGNGGFMGVGLGGGKQKLFFLPEAHTDFIYAVIAEEAGLIGTVAILALFIAILWRGYRIARRVNDTFLKLCAMGFVLLLVVQALMNMSVVLSLAPNKGIPLPFISFGPNSLIASLICLGLLLAISKEAGSA
ncbi:putative lipid II flippase FtsW [Geothrix edaphica]|uniref:Probable peptidoglycan glycosyltransferase FtsW n=1 Tax=Geothrix edaphica TaxID=2927976 RepID=A0ABQ5PW42_9BACT|nr:putative lipid II flippase FtsW [Geothrix edaphica]GLH66538.1 stage V sporulation protein E [Geothrix edaphica]